MEDRIVSKDGNQAGSESWIKISYAVEFTDYRDNEEYAKSMG